MTAKSESPARTTGTIESPLLNISDTVCWRGRWWMLDVETSGLNHQKDDIIALRLACMENYNITQEREILVRPRNPLRPWVERLTGISNQNLEQAASLDWAIDQLEELDSPVLFHDGNFTRPFLQNAYLRCGQAFSRPCLLLDRLAALLLGYAPKQKADKILEKLPPPDGVRPCLKIVNTPKRRIFFRHTALKILEIHRVFLRIFALSGVKISRRWAYCQLSNKA